jgi:uncharacterized protein YdgA (DUF945 family)
MKKIVIIAGGLLIVGLLAATWYSSVKTEKIFALQVEKARELYGHAISVSLDNYDRGFLHSQAETTMMVKASPPLHFLHRMTHLPWGAKVVTTVDREAYHKEELAEIESGLPFDQLQVISRFRLDGQSDIRMKMAAVEVGEGGQKISLDGLEMNASLNSAMDDGDVDFRIEGIGFQKTDSDTGTIKGFHGIVHYREQGGFPLGDGVLRADEIDFGSDDAARYVLNNLAYRFNGTLDDGMLNQSVDIDFGSMQIADEICRRGRLKFEITGMNAKAVRALQETYGAMSKKALTGDEIDPFLIQLQVFSKTMELLQKGLHVKLENFELETDAGKISARGAVDLEDMGRKIRPVFDVNAVRAEATLHFEDGAFTSGYRLISAMRGEHLPVQELTRRAESLSDTLVAQNILIRNDDGSLVADFAFKDGAGKLNGKPVSR